MPCFSKSLNKITEILLFKIPFSCIVPRFVASNAVDGNTGTYWHSDNSGFSHWWKYDLGAGVTKIASKIRIYPREYDGVSAIKDFTIQGSNNDSSWTTLHTGQHTNAIAWEDFVFSNSTEYRYYKIEITSIWSGSDNYTIISEIEMMELSLESYSESSIKTQGSYSLKGIGLITVSLNETLTKTF